MTLIADVFPKLRTPKKVVRYRSKKSRFSGPFDRQHGKQAGKEGKKLKKIEYPQKEKSFLDETKNIFHSFESAIIYKIKI